MKSNPWKPRYGRVGMVVLSSGRGRQVLQEILDNGIKIYNGEIDEEEDSPEVKELRVRKKQRKREGETNCSFGRMQFQWQ